MGVTLQQLQSQGWSIKKEALDELAEEWGSAQEVLDNILDLDLKKVHSGEYTPSEDVVCCCSAKHKTSAQRA